MGPLYKTIAQGVSGSNLLTTASQYSVSKINQMLSLFVATVWLILFASSILPLSTILPIDWRKVLLVLLTACAIGCLLARGRSDNKATNTKLVSRELIVES